MLAVMCHLLNCHAGDAQAQATSRPARLQRRALRGLAQIAGAKGDAGAAEQLLRRILGPAADLPARQQQPSPEQQQQQSFAALSALEHILGAAASQAPAPAFPPAAGEHWAHGDYGWHLFERGRVEVPPCAPLLLQRLLPPRMRSRPQPLTTRLLFSPT